MNLRMIDYNIHVKFISIFIYCHFITLNSHPILTYINTTYTKQTVIHNRTSSLSYCKSNEHIAGFWNKSIEIDLTKPGKLKSFYCCGWDNNDYLFSPNECGYQHYPTRYHNEESYIGSTTSIYTHAGGHACVCDALNENIPKGRWLLNERELYKWIPAYCDLLEWNGLHFCSLLGNRTILLVGDSTMGQTSSTLMNMIKSHHGLCNTQIRFGRTDYLISSDNHGWGALEFVDEFKPNIAIFNYGAHGSTIQDIENLWLHFIPQIRKMYHLYPNMTLIWKTQNPGHVNCSLHSHIHGDDGDINKHPINYYDPYHSSHKGDYYKWYNFPLFDDISKNNIIYLYEKFNITMKVIDMSPLNFRPDAHARPAQDCLHYCLPGPINLFSILLLQMLQNYEI